MRKSVNIINSDNVVIDKEKLQRYNLKYINLYSKSCYELYDLGYQSTPSIFLEEEFLTALTEEFPDCVKLLTSGFNQVLIKEPLFFKYITKVSGNEDFNRVIMIYSNILECIEAFDNYTELIKRVHFKKDSGLAYIKPRISAITTIRNMGVIPLDSKYIQELFYLEDEYKLITCDFRGLWLKFICNEIGITEDEYNYCRESNKSLFSDKLSFNDDLDIVKYILSGDVLTDSENTNKLKGYLRDFYRNYGKKHKDYTNLEEKIYLEKEGEFNEYIESFKLGISDLGGEEYYITNMSATFKVPVSEEDFKFEESNDIISIGVPLNSGSNDEYILGRFVMDNKFQDMLNIGNTLRGISGEFISDTYISTRDYNISGLPVELIEFTSRGTPVTRKYYPIFNIRSKDNRNIYPVIGYDGHEIHTVDEEKLLQFCDITNIVELEGALLRVLGEVLNNNPLTPLIVKCLCAVIYMSCGREVTNLEFLKELNESNSNTVLFNVDKYYNILLNNSGAR